MTPLSFKEWMTHHPGECIEHYMGLHDSLFEAGRYDMLTDIYSGMFLYMPSDPDGNPDTLRRQLLRIMPLYNQVLSKTGAYEAAVQLLDSIRLSGHPFLTGYCAYPLWAFEAQNSLMTDDNRRTEALADFFCRAIATGRSVGRHAVLPHGFVGLPLQQCSPECSVPDAGTGCRGLSAGWGNPRCGSHIGTVGILLQARRAICKSC
ncbi:hypothetical protein NXV19_16130 [Bacteroides fragilis]|nr:hypothetical protein NXV19_16130 [Bacteroides fragilis]